MKKNMDHAEPPMYRIPTVCKLYDMTEATVRDLVRTRKIGYCKAAPGVAQSMIRIPKSEIEKYLQYVPPVHLSEDDCSP